MQLRSVLGRAFRLRCPRCGRGALYGGVLRPNDACAGCRLDFRQESGYYVGSMWLNYGWTALTGIALGLILLGRVSTGALVGIVSGWGLIVPVLFFHHARALWLGGELWLRSRTTEPDAEGQERQQGPGRGDP